MAPHHQRVAALVPEMFFAARIAQVAQASGVTLETLAGFDDLTLARLRAAPPGLVILDLSAPDALPLARAMRADATLATVPLVGFYAHVDGRTRVAALEAGVDDVLPKSAFTQRLPELVAGA